MGLLSTIIKATADNDARRDAAAERKAQKDAELKLKKLEAQRRIRPLIEDAYTRMGDDSGQLGKTIDDIFAAYTFETGDQVDENVIKALKDPKFGPALIDASTESGATLGDVFKQGANPLLRAEARIALAGHAQRSRLRNSVAGEAPGSQPAANVNPGATSTAPVEPSADKVQAVSLDGLKTSAPAASPAAPATPQPTAALAPHVAAIDQQITSLEQQRAAIATNPASTPAHLTGVDQRLKDLRDRRARLVEGVDLNATEQDIRRRGEAAPEAVQRETGALTRGAQEDMARNPGAGRLLTPAELESQKEAAQQAEREAGGLRKTIRESAEGSRKSLPVRQRAAAVLERAGRTGAIVGPLRKGIGQVLQLALMDDKIVNRVMKLSDVEMLEQANVELALAGLKGIGGNDTERELLTMMQSNPGLLRSKSANQFASRWAIASDETNLYRDQLADKWMEDRAAEGRPASLRSRDKWGKSFTQRWDEYTNNHPLFVRVARDLGLDPVEFAASIGYDRAKADRAFGGR